MPDQSSQSDQSKQVETSRTEQFSARTRPRQFRIDWFLVATLLLALVLYSWKIWEAGSANDFYTAAITSMTQNFKNFWYASFDPAGYITVDKPPVALWFMAISAKIFGVHQWSVVLPSVLFGLGSVYLMYRLVRPRFGRVAGNLAALAMTLTPIAVADSRTNNMDATLIYFLLFAIYMLQKAVDKQKLWYLVASFGIIGVAFNVKMLQAFMILPGMLLFYWLASHHNWKKKLAHLSAATVALVVFTLIWPVSVDMTSASKRPYEGGSEHNSVLELAFGYNGTERLLGQTTGTGGAFPGMGSNSKSKSNTGMPQGGQPGGTTNGNRRTTNGQPGGTPPGGTQGGNRRGGGAMGGGGAGGAFNIGTAGPLRLFQDQLGPQISWLLPFSVIGMISAFAFFIDRKRKWYQLTANQKQVVMWAGWLVPVYGFFSVASFFHPYYTIMLAPPIAAFFGIGVVTMFKQLRAANWKDWKRYLLPLAVTATAFFQAWYVSSYYAWASWLLIFAGIGFGLILLVKPAKPLRSLTIGGLVAILLAPAFWSATPAIAGESAAIPTAGPDLLSSNGQGGAGGGVGNGTVNTKLLNYLEKRQGNAKYLFATDDSGTAAPYIIKTGKAVMAMGGFNGTDPAITLSKFKQLVKNGEIKYYYAGGKSGSANSAIVNWIKKHAKKVKASDYGGTTTTTGNANSETNAKSTNRQQTMGQMPSQSGRMKGGPNMRQNGKFNGKRPSMKPSSTKGKQSQQMPTGGGMMGGNSGTLYDLSSIYK
ncbi:glycosyltransferase family 39 protein (plasmid) [Nicoliella spurrieriana]|uniref:Glycosyltransferase family 39 protein n=1 Tax=Nicoliella spurrieriana TaxID=2925830 RepID=A0A976RQD9_9LACO|nr:glycosyltransferase family 39 protein [Nicoliella spurrieriana]UQS85962.1 glycosyltransferase family 39 protein [Nicoliella spurrieriana]